MSFGISAAGWIAGAAVAGTVVQARSASRAARAQERAADQAGATELEMYYQSRDDRMPWMGAGTSSVNQLSALLGIDAGPNQTEQNFNTARYLELNPDAQEYMRTSGNTAYQHWIADGRRRTGDFWNTDPNANRVGSANFGALNKQFTLDDFQKDPGYEFRVAEGMKGVNNSAAARGGLLSGAALKAAARVNQDIASNEFGNAFNRFQTNQTNQFNRLASLANVGQITANQNANNAIQTGQSVGQNMLAGGAARASGYIGQNNALMGGTNTLYGIGKNNGWWGNSGAATGPVTNADGSYNYDANGWWDVNSWGNS